MVNVDRDHPDPDGVFARHRRLIASRRDRAVIRHGDWRLLLPDDTQVFACLRTLGGARLLVVANFSSRPATVSLPARFGTQDGGTDDGGGAGVDLLTQRHVRVIAGIAPAPCEAIAVRSA